MLRGMIIIKEITDYKTKQKVIEKIRPKSRHDFICGRGRNTRFFGGGIRVKYNRVYKRRIIGYTYTIEKYKRYTNKPNRWEKYKKKLNRFVNLYQKINQNH